MKHDKSIKKIQQDLIESKVKDSSEIKQTVDTLTERINNCQITEVEKLKNAIDHLEQQARMNNLIISGLIEKPNENLGQVLIELAESITVKITGADIASISELEK